MNVFLRIASVALLALASASALATPLYGGNGSLYEIDSATGVSNVIDTGNSAYRLGLAWNAQTSTMYSAGSFDGVLSTLDLSNGDTTAVGPGNGTFMTGLTFSGDYSTLYAFNGNGGALISVDPSTGVATTIGGFGGGVLDLSTRSDGSVFAAGSGGIYQMDLVNGARTHVGGSRRYTAIAFDETDTLFGIDISSDALYSIDLQTGVETLIGGDIGSDVRGMAFAFAAIPVPAPAGIAVLFLVVLLRRR